MTAFHFEVILYPSVSAFLKSSVGLFQNEHIHLNCNPLFWYMLRFILITGLDNSL